MEIYVGQLFGFWKVLELPELKKPYSFKCICTKCNKSISLIAKSRLLNKNSYNECRRCLRYFDDYIGYPEHQKRYFSHLKSNAKKRKIPFTLKIEEVYKLLIKQNFKCKISNLDININHSENNTASIDRIDNSKGYIKNNIQWVHIDINRAKGTLSLNEYIKQCKLVADFNN